MNTNRIMRVTAFVVAVVAATGACGASDNDNANSAVLQELFPGTDPSTIPSAQQQALADGMVSFDEYQGAILARIDCLAERGFEATSEYDANLATFNLRVPASDGVETAVEECSLAHTTFVEVTYTNKHGPTTDDLRNGLLPAIPCLQLADPGFPTDASFEELNLGISDLESDPEVAECLRAALS